MGSHTDSKHFDKQKIEYKHFWYPTFQTKLRRGVELRSTKVSAGKGKFQEAKHGRHFFLHKRQISMLNTVTTDTHTMNMNHNLCFIVLYTLAYRMLHKYSTLNSGITWSQENYSVQSSKNAASNKSV